MAPLPRTLTADRGDAGRRLDLVVRRHLSGVESATRTRVQTWIERGLVTVNGATVQRVAARVALGDRVAVDVPPEDRRGDAPVMQAEHIVLDVLYEDEHLIAVNKPPGVVVHPTYGHGEGTVMNGLLWRAREWPAGHRPSIVGRLDKLTSGIVVAAKSARAHAVLQRAMASRARKQYLALVYGLVNTVRGEIDLRLRRDPRDRRRVLASPSMGAVSLTRFERLGRIAAPPVGLSLLRCHLVTGRMHQIRVHLAACGWPIVGDPVYSEPRWTHIADAALAQALRRFPRQALHAWRLAMAHPATGETLTIEAPVPPDMVDVLRAAGLVKCAR